jgi:hypothetical protein
VWFTPGVKRSGIPNSVQDFTSILPRDAVFGGPSVSDAPSQHAARDLPSHVAVDLADEREGVGFIGGPWRTLPAGSSRLVVFARVSWNEVVVKDFRHVNREGPSAHGSAKEGESEG